MIVKHIPVGLLHAEKMAEAVLLNVPSLPLEAEQEKGFLEFLTNLA